MAANALTDPDLALARRRVDLIRRGRIFAAEHKREFCPDWYSWQRAYFAVGAEKRERMLLAGNQVGKTMTSTYEDALHLTGDYPDWWVGARISHPITAWALGVDNQQLKDVLQKALIGDLLDGDKVTGGWIHPDEVVGVTRSQTPGLARDFSVKRKGGGVSTITLRAYSQARTGSDSLPFAGSVVDLIHVDEQPPDDIVGQLVVRTMNGRRGKGGLLNYSMTPEMGMTGLVQRFMENRGAHQALIGPIAWRDCKHLTPELQEQILASIPPFEREMRSEGKPYFGTGLVFPIDEGQLRCAPFALDSRPWYRVIRAIDIGIDHPTAIVWLAWDPEQDVVYVTRTHRKSDEIVAAHAATANSQWAHAPMVFPPDADQREKGSGASVRGLYEQAGISNTADFCNPDESKFVEPGLMAMYERMRTGRFKVFSTCTEFFDELRKYHRKDGKLVKVDDDVISAVRYGHQMIQRFGVPVMAAPKFTGTLAPAWRL